MKLQVSKVRLNWCKITNQIPVSYSNDLKLVKNYVIINSNKSAGGHLTPPTTNKMILSNTNK